MPASPPKARVSSLHRLSSCAGKTEAQEPARSPRAISLVVRRYRGAEVLEMVSVCSLLDREESQTVAATAFGTDQSFPSRASSSVQLYSVLACILYSGSHGPSGNKLVLLQSPQHLVCKQPLFSDSYFTIFRNPINQNCSFAVVDLE